MNPGDLKYKFTQIFLPLMLLAVGFVALYSAANWFLFSDSGLTPLDQDLANLWLPIGLGLILAVVLIAPRLRVLKLKATGNRSPVLYYLVAAAAVLITPAGCTQTYVATASGKLTKVESASAIPSAPRTKYYAAGQVCIDRRKPVVQRVNETSGRSNQYLDFNLYVLVPVCNTDQQPAWIGFKYTDSTDNTASQAVKEANYREFLQKSQAQFDAFDPRRIRYLESLGRTKDRRNYEKALPNTAAAKSLPLILIPHEDAFDARNGDALENAGLAFGISAGIFLVMLLFPDLDEDKVAEAKKPRGERAPTEAHAWLAFVVPTRDAYGIPILIDINLAVYLAMVLSGLGVMSFQADDLLKWGANYGPPSLGNGAYRLITSQFVHGGLMHLLTNMYGLLIGGVFLSPIIRKAGPIVCYLVCGLGGAITSAMVHPTVVGVGASGAIMGLWGTVLMLALLGDKRIGAGRRPIILNCLLFAGLTLAQGAVNPEIDNAAHIGGLVTGLVIGGLMFWFSWGEQLQPTPSSSEPQLSNAAPSPDGR
jgi:membrane associated rhomboid family serine protease